MYAITRPPRETQTTPPPLLLLLHGFGSNEHDLMGLAPYLDARCTIASVRAVYDLGFGYAWYYLYGMPGNLQHDDESRARSLEMLTDYVASAPARFGTDPQQVYLLGFSQGAVMSLNVALTAPHLVAGVIALSGYLDDMVVPRVETEQLHNLHALIVHGTLDNLIPVAGSRKVHAFLRRTPAKVVYHEYPIDHGIHPDSLDVIGGWLKDRIDARQGAAVVDVEGQG